MGARIVSNGWATHPALRMSQVVAELWWAAVEGGDRRLGGGTPSSGMPEPEHDRAADEQGQAGQG